MITILASSLRFVVLTVALLMACGPVTAVACDAAAFHAAETRADATELAAQLKRLEADPKCSADVIVTYGRRGAIALYKAAFAAGVPTDQRSTRLDAALKLGRPWQVLAAAADVAKSRRDHTRAATLYQEALDDIRNERLNPSAPKPAVIATLVKNAEAMSLLSATHVARVDRSGAPGGLACPALRDLVIQKVSVAVEFEYREPGFKKVGAEAFTAKGRAAAEDLLATLMGQQPTKVTLIGHTDPVGGDDYNQRLSERRAEAVKAFLAAKGYSGAIATSGRGRSEPFEPDEPGTYSQADRHQMDRRVEFEREGGKSCAKPGG